jgi:predicted phosphodiesterase
VGNHGRSQHKRSKERALTSKWDAYENQVFVALKEIFDRCKSNVEINVPSCPFVIFDVQGHKFFATHGDTVINVGNTNNVINMKNLTDQVNRINAGLAKVLKEEVAVVMVGHVHHPCVQILDNGVYFLINGCSSGLDPYANAQCCVFDSHPTQEIFEVTKDYPVGDIRLIGLREYDNKEELDKIIKPYKSPFTS